MSTLFDFMKHMDKKPLGDVISSLIGTTRLDNVKTNSKSYGELAVDIRPIHKSDILFSPIPQLKCVQCGFYGRTYYCGPWIADYKKWQERINNQDFILLIAGYIDVTPRIKENMEKFNTPEWKAHFYAGNEGSMVIKSKVEKISLEVIQRLYPYIDRYINFDTGGGCRRCRQCGKHTGKACKHPKVSNVAPEAAGVELYTMLTQIYDNFQIPPQNIYYSVKLVTFKFTEEFDEKGIVKSMSLSFPYTHVDDTEAYEVYKVREIYNPDIRSECDQCRRRVFTCDINIDPDDLYKRIKDMKVFVYRDVDSTSPNGINKLYQKQLELHRKGYWWSFHLTPYGCNVCSECTLDIHRTGAYKKVTNRHIPFCPRIFYLDVEMNDGMGYILV